MAMVEMVVNGNGGQRRWAQLVVSMFHVYGAPSVLAVCHTSYSELRCIALLFDV